MDISVLVGSFGGVVVVVFIIVVGKVDGFEARVVVGKVICFEKRSSVNFAVGCDALIVLKAEEKV